MPALIIENGSGEIKFGFKKNDFPSLTFPNVIGKTDSQNVRRRMPIRYNSQFIGDNAQKFRGILSLSYPNQRGVITNWDATEKIWNFGINEICKSDFSKKIILTSTPLSPKRQHWEACELLFEKLQASSVHLTDTGSTALKSTERSTGVVVDCGESISYVMPIISGFSKPEWIMAINLGGRDINYYIGKLLVENGQVDLTSTISRLEIARQIKHDLCYVSLNYNRESHLRKQSDDIYYEMPDMSEVSLKNECYNAPECLFKPKLAGINGKGIHLLVFDAICAASGSDEVMEKLLENIVVCGGTTMLPNFPQRLKLELESLFPSPDFEIELEVPKQRRYLSWLGASQLQRVSWLTKADYDEFGKAIIYRKFRLL